MNGFDVKSVLKNILTVLQKKPAHYRTFGIYWWPVKAMLKRYYTTEHLYMLGDYEDPDGAARVPDVGVQRMLKLALEEQMMNATYGMGGNRVTDTEGEPYVIFDEDAGF